VEKLKIVKLADFWYNKVMKNALLKPLFWELDAEKLDVKENARQIIERILEFGNLHQVNWMRKTYPVETIKEAIRASRQLSPKSANFWALYYKIPQSEVRCLIRLLQKQQKVLWPY